MVWLVSVMLKTCVGGSENIRIWDCALSFWVWLIGSIFDCATYVVLSKHNSCMGFGPCEVFNFVLDHRLLTNAIGHKFYGDTNTQTNHLQLTVFVVSKLMCISASEGVYVYILKFYIKTCEPY